jgi:copper homeostasis protein
MPKVHRLCLRRTAPHCIEPWRVVEWKFNHNLTTKAIRSGGWIVNRRVMVEICVSDVESAIVAQDGGADRVELCDNLAVGGTTPSAGTIAEVRRRLSIPVHVLIRPRAGDFVYSGPELAVMRHDIAVTREIGAAGVVLGALDRDGSIDRAQTASLIALARPLHVIFHKAFDQTRDLEEALEVLIELGVDRVLTAGGEATALEGIMMLAKLVDRSRSRIAIMAGGRLGVESLETVILRSGVREAHVGSAVTEPIPSASEVSARIGSPALWDRTDLQRVAAVVALARGSLR